MRTRFILYTLFLSCGLAAQTGSLRQLEGGNALVDQDRYQLVSLPQGSYATTEEFFAAQRSRLGLDKGIGWVAEGEATTGGKLRFQRYAQHYRGVPVFNGTVTVATDAGGKPTHLSGTTIALAEFSTAPASLPKIPTARLIELTKLVATDWYRAASDWAAIDLGEIWATTNPWAEGFPYRLTRTIQLVGSSGTVGHQFYLDAHTGKLVFEHPLHHSLNRQLFRGNSSNSNRIWAEGQPLPADLTAEEDDLLQSTAETFYLYHRTFGRLGYNGTNGLMKIIADRIGSCPNASAFGNTISHCDGVVADDIVAHEWTHNYIGSINGLIYRYESGAVNEGLADVFGESLDLINGRGGDFNDHLPRGNCNDTGLRWKLGEDGTALGILRDLWQPECMTDPGSRGSADYVCWNLSQDNGGVHVNSGLVNRSFSLLVDGGTLNGTTVTAIGHTKALHIFYHAMLNYVTRATDFDAFGVMLEQSATDLIGTNLPSLTVVNLPAMLSGEFITATDVQQVANAVTATGMNAPSPCNFQPTLAQNPPADCSGNAPVVDVVLLSEDWESGMGTWTTSAEPVNPSTFDNPLWLLEDNLPDGRPGQGMFVANAFLGDCQSDKENGQVHLFSPSVTIPTTATTYTLSFDHYYSTEEDYDGGILSFSVGGGSYTYVPETSFLYNGYDGALNSTSNDNPLAGVPAFHGADQNSTTGTWGTSLVDVASLGVQPGDDVSFRWTLSMDGCNGWLGWYLDEVRLVTCEAQSLPVVYTDLRAYVEKTSVFVEWATAEEINNRGFYVERAEANEGIFSSLGFVAAGERYSFEDRTTRPETNYLYRLRQVDFDGTEDYSSLVRARRGLNGEVAVFPNPAHDVLTVFTQEDSGTIYLMDLAGRQVQRSMAEQGRATMNVGSLPPGVYLLRGGFGVRRVVVR